VSLGARVVRISNSIVFAGGGISSVEEAVQRIGFAEIYRLVGMATTSSFADRALTYYGIESDTLHDVMLHGALASEALARAAGADPRPAYTAGLLRPLGMMVLDRAARLHLKVDAAFTRGFDESYSTWEGRMFGVGSCEISALILEEWRFPRPLAIAVREHYLARSSDYHNPFACRLNLAGWIAREAGAVFPGESACWELTPQKLAGAHLTEEQLRTAAAETAEAFGQARMALS
jgi:HD-like signal output (HDOD) protein